MKHSEPEPAAGRRHREWLWEFASARGMSRRQFLRLMMGGGTLAVIAACVGTPPLAESPQPAATHASRSSASTSPWFKDPEPFIRHDNKNLEARLEGMQGLLTPTCLFFVRNNSSSLDLSASGWRLSVEGNAVAETTELTYDDIRSLPSRTLTSYLECAGNHRAMFDLVK